MQEKGVLVVFPTAKHVRTQLHALSVLMAMNMMKRRKSARRVSSIVLEIKVGIIKII